MENQWYIKNRKIGIRSWEITTGIARKEGLKNKLRLGFHFGTFRVVLLAGHNDS